MIRIITDSACDLPPEILAEYGIRVMPMSITFGSGTFADQVDISTDVFFERLLAEAEYPRTSYPSIGRYQMAIDEELAAGNEVIVITIAAALSGCYEAVSVLAGDYPADRVVVFDSKSATLGQGAIVLAAARLIEGGADFNEVLAAMPGLIDRFEGYGAINNLVYLVKGGRLSNTAATLATALNIKPVIGFNKDGSLMVAQKIRGMAKAIAWLKSRIRKDGEDFSNTTVFVGYIVQRESAEKLMLELKEELNLGEVLLCQMGPTVGAHLGPGCVALFYLRP